MVRRKGGPAGGVRRGRGDRVVGVVFMVTGW
jgi:hypothetical protein